MDEEAVEYMYERGFNSGGLEDSVIYTDMEGEGRCSRSGEMKVLERIRKCGD